MTELWQRFALEPVDRVRTLDRALFLEHYRGRRPVILEAGAADSLAVAKWDPAYLAATAGDATVAVAAYRRDHRDYGSVEPRKMSFRAFLAELGDAGAGEVRYLFNDESCVFARIEDEPRYHVGWASTPNPGLAPLAADLRLPSLVDPEAFVLAVLIVGSHENATDLHYDLGGEAKVLVQVRGRKRIVLLPPDAAPELRPHPILQRPGSTSVRPGSRPRLDIHAQAEGASEADSAIGGYLAEIAPGDVVYWPPFWFHDIANLDPVTIAIGLFVEEIALHPLALRYVAGGIARALVESARRRTASASRDEEAGQATWSAWDLEVSRDGRAIATLGELVSDLEERLMSPEMREMRWLWDWNHRIWPW